MAQGRGRRCGYVRNGVANDLVVGLMPSLGVSWLSPYRRHLGTGACAH